MANVKLGDVYISAVGAVAWAMTAGVEPFQAEYTVHRSQWEDVEAMLGTPQTLTIEGINGSITVQDVYPLYRTPQSSPNRAHFIVSDKRWLWPYKIIVRDYNVTRKTGDRALLLQEGQDVPIETALYVDRYRYLTYSLDGGQRWAARRVIEDVLEVLEPGNYSFSSFPVEGDGVEGQASIQNLMLRDGGHQALQRAMRYAPGAAPYVDLHGHVKIFDATDVQATKDYVDDLSPIYQTGGYPTFMERKHIRPSDSIVYFVRELEMRVDIMEDLAKSATVVEPNIDEPFIINVLPLPDPKTKNVRVRDEDGDWTTVEEAAQGTWVEVREALRAWEQDRQDSGGSGSEWTFETLQKHWVPGGLEAVWAGPGVDLDEDALALSRLNALKQHFRQTFMINPRYMRRIRELKAVRVAIMDTVTGTRAPALFWSQYCVIPSAKGIILEAREGTNNQSKWYNVDQYPGYDSELTSRRPSQGGVSIMDGQLGVFRLNYTQGPYGIQQSFVPSMLGKYQGESFQSLEVPTMLLREQDDRPIAAGAHVESAPDIFLSPKFNAAAVLSIIQNSPNNKEQLHAEYVSTAELEQVYRTSLGITDGEGPVLEIFVPPNICTARFGWQATSEARATLRDLFGVASDQDAVGLSKERQDMPGFLFVNGQDEIPANAQAAVIEALVRYVDTHGGNVSTVFRNDQEPTGNMNSVAFTVAPSGRMSMNHGFTGAQAQVDRFAFLPTDVRAITLGIIPYGKDDR